MYGLYWASGRLCLLADVELRMDIPHMFVRV
jgi:hypothetical protein